jgi:hypothetical protein
VHSFEGRIMECEKRKEDWLCCACGDQHRKQAAFKGNIV